MRLGSIAFVLIIGFVLAGLGAMQPLLTRLIIDDGLIARHYQTLVIGCVGVLCLALFSMALGAWHRRVYVKVSGDVLFAIRETLYVHLMSVSPRQLQTRSVGDYVSRLDGDIAEIQRFGMDAVAAAINGTLGLLAAFIVMASLSWRLSLLVVLLMPVQLLIRHYARPHIERNARAVREQSAVLGSFLIETLGNVRGIVGHAGEDQEVRRLQALQRGYLERVIDQQMLSVLVGGAAAFAGHLVTAAIFLIGGWAAIHGSLTLGTLIAFVTYFGRGAGSAGSVLALYTGYQRAKVSLHRIDELMRLPVIPTLEAAIALPATGGRIELCHVTVQRPDGGDIVRDLDIEIAAGRKVQLAGASGAGKTTVVDLLRRFVEPVAGIVLIDGRDIRTYDLRDIRRRIVAIESAPFVRAGSLWENLIYGLETVDDRAVYSVAVQCGLTEIASQLDDGFETRVGDRGSGLSSGQCQRIAIARLLLRDPLVVILDEATNALDRTARDSLEDLVDTHFRDRTRIVITHTADTASSTEIIRLPESDRA